MTLEMDNSGAVDIANSWSVGGRTWHVDLWNYILCELKNQGLLIIKHFAGDDNDADIFTKNVMSAVFNRQVPLYMGLHEYVQVQDRASSREAVSDKNSLNLGAGVVT